MENRATGSVRTSIENNEKIISGYAIKWESWSKELRNENGIFVEQFLKGAFTKSLRNRNQSALVNHMKNAYLGSVEDGRLFLEEDDIGLAFKLVLSGDYFSEFVYERVKSGEFSHVSVCFHDPDDTWERKDSKRHRTIKTASLLEISLCEVPAYSDSIAKVGDQRERLKLLHKIDKTILEVKRKEIIRTIKNILKTN